MFQGHRITPPKWDQLPTKIGSEHPYVQYIGKETVEMSGTLWCDIPDPETDYTGQTGHPFSSKDPDRRHYEETQTVDVPTGNSYGRTTYQPREEITESLDICGYHMRKRNPFQANPQDSLKVLEEKNADWQAGYEAAGNHERYVQSHTEPE